MEGNSIVEAQYRKIYLVELCEKECIEESEILADSLKFWQSVAKHNNLRDPETFALTCLITPTDDSIVERIFSSSLLS